MIEAEKIGALLDQQKALMDTLKGQKVGGFFIIVPPEGEPITQIILGTEPAPQAFYKAIAERCSEVQKSSETMGRGGYVGGGR